MSIEELCDHVDPDDSDHACEGWPNHKGRHHMEVPGAGLVVWDRTEDERPAWAADPDAILDEIIGDGEAARARLRAMAEIGSAPDVPGAEFLRAGGVAIRYGSALILYGGVEFAKSLALGQIVKSKARRWGQAAHDWLDTK